MMFKPACAAATPLVPGLAPDSGAQAHSRLASSGMMRALSLAQGLMVAVALVLLPPVASAAPAAAPLDTDQPIWRATHGLLLGIARAGGRLVAVGNAGMVLLSDDEGKTWRMARSPTDELLTAVIFPTPAQGWAVGQDGEVLHSGDGGESWVQQHLSAGSDQALFTVVSLTDQHLLASGAYNLILETQDGGATWKDSKIDNLDDDYHLNCAVARGDDIMITGEAGHAFIRYAGAWTQVKLPYDGSQFACLLGPDGSFYSFGLRGSAFKIQPGDTQWSRIDLAEPYSIFGATNLANGTMALVGSNGLILLLDPATGQSTQLPAPTDKALSGVVEGQGGRLITVGDDGVHLIDPPSAPVQPGVGQ
jgi:photosystem II stability/assembly factor-like uncharacterized protein